MIPRQLGGSKEQLSTDLCKLYKVWGGGEGEVRLFQRECGRVTEVEQTCEWPKWYEHGYVKAVVQTAARN